MLQIQQLTKRYGEKTAVDALTLTIRPGEIFGFIGPNGAGKTTTLKCCCGILQPDSGEVRVDGISVREDPLAAKRKLAYLPDNPDLYHYMTGIQYLDFIADIFGVSDAARAERVRMYGERFGLTGALAQPIGDYSHGMKQKLAIIAALLHAPKLILMDEPFVGLDPLAPAQADHAGLLRHGRGHLFLDACAGSGGKALRSGGHHQKRQAHPGGLHGRGAGRRLAGNGLLRVGGRRR